MPYLIGFEQSRHFLAVSRCFNLERQRSLKTLFNEGSILFSFARQHSICLMYYDNRVTIIQWWHQIWNSVQIIWYTWSQVLNIGSNSRKEFPLCGKNKSQLWSSHKNAYTFWNHFKTEFGVNPNYSIQWCQCTFVEWLLQNT